MEVVAGQAVNAIAREFDHSTTCDQLVSRIYLADATVEEQRRTRETVAVFPSCSSTTTNYRLAGARGP